MASNKIPRTNDELLGQGEDSHDGLVKNQDTVGVKQNRADVLMAFILAARAAEVEYQTKRNVRKVASTGQHEADVVGRSFIMRGRNVLEPHLGYSWSPAWAPVGFVSPTLSIPSTIDGRMAMLGSMKLYLAANPAYENAPLNVTSAEAEAVYQALSDNRSATNEATEAAETARIKRDAAFRDLGRCLSGLLAELTQLLSPDDPRWYAFGFNRPSDPETPEIPQDLVINPAYQGHSIATCERARRAERYRFWRQIDGETEYTPVLTVEEPQAVLNSVPTGQKVRYYVTAANDAGESLPSNTVEIVVP
jgi:hypothetical protein